MKKKTVVGYFVQWRRGYYNGSTTKYNGRVVTETDNGRSFAVKLHLPSTNIQLDPKGYPLPRRHLICKLVNILLSNGSNNPLIYVQEYLQTQSISPPLTVSEASEILKSIHHSPPLALQFFKFCPLSIPKFRHDCFTYNRILLILSSSLNCDRFDSVRAVINDMERLGVRGNISTVNLLIGIFGADEMCMQLLKKWELKMNRYTYKCLLQAHLRGRDSGKGLRVYHDMTRKGYYPDIFAYNMLLDALAKDYKVDEANKVFQDMKRKHCEPDQYTYTIMIRMTGKIGKHDDAIALFHEMLSKKLAPNLIAYNTTIQVLAMNRMVDKTIYLFSKMVENDCRPNEFTYSVILNVLASEGQLGRLDEVVQISKKYMNKGIYAYLVRTLSKLGHASEAHRLFCYMWNYHDKGDRDAYLSMLESLCKEGKMIEAMDLLSKIHEKGIDSDTIMYNTVFTALGKSKQISHLLDLYDKMKQDGPLPDIFTYNILISSFGRAARVDEAVKIFEELENNSDCKPDIVSYNSLINCLGKNGDVDEAHMRFKEMEEKGLNPDVVTYSTLIECFGKSDKVDMACRLFDQMLSHGCYPNIVTYNILLDCLERCGRTAEAVDLYAKLKEQGLTPDSITYSILERLQSGSHRKFRTRRQNPITGWVVSPLRAPIVGLHHYLMLFVMLAFSVLFGSIKAPDLGVVQDVPQHPHPCAQKFYVSYASDSYAIRTVIYQDMVYVTITNQKKNEDLAHGQNSMLIKLYMSMKSIWDHVMVQDDEYRPNCGFLADFLQPLPSRESAWINLLKKAGGGCYDLLYSGHMLVSCPYSYGLDGMAVGTRHGGLGFSVGLFGRKKNVNR
uniref:Pentatricopeptide repeat-containing protein At1g51965, mitochondrial n=1 Tax=Tanacetum cinerariifolium TaxID=118510 RepID=A0A6L2KND2_TANCI|nr:pentatricopeptide repeat-containing protein At1g51965, mitochondrial [Tanacetum cinerariifolium]